MSPVRVQRRRTKGWRMPAGAVYVGRPSKWGNPCDWHAYEEWYPDESPSELRRMAAGDFGMFVRDRSVLGEPRASYPTLEEIKSDLAGKDLACWCPFDQPCHADVLLDLANAGAE